jgi:ribosomal protein S18 acetylase RimI-like enzyme
MAELSFRRARPEDAAEVAVLVNSAYRGESSKRGWTTEADFLGGQRTDSDEVRQLIEANDSMMLLCFQGTELIGSVHLEHADDGAYLGMLTVKPTLQGRGIGKRFMKVAERTARAEWQVRKIVMMVITLREELIAFYERRGYRRTGKFDPFPTDPKFGLPRVAGLQFEYLEKNFDD